MPGSCSSCQRLTLLLPPPCAFSVTFASKSVQWFSNVYLSTKGACPLRYRRSKFDVQVGYGFGKSRNQGAEDWIPTPPHSKNALTFHTCRSAAFTQMARGNSLFKAATYSCPSLFSKFGLPGQNELRYPVSAFTLVRRPISGDRLKRLGSHSNFTSFAQVFYISFIAQLTACVCRPPKMAWACSQKACSGRVMRGRL